MPQATLTLIDTPAGGVAMKSDFSPAVGNECSRAQALALDIIRVFSSEFPQSQPANTNHTELPPMHHIMIDLETLGTTADAVILSIGAVRFDIDSGTVEDSHGFYVELDITNQQTYKRQISADTLKWWMGQAKKAQEVFNSNKPKVGLYTALSKLNSWINLAPDPYVWSNGADFDLPMLVHAYTAIDFDLPWKPYAGRCYRTYKNLPGARAVKVERVGQHHNALDDAVYQAQHLCAIHEALFVTPQATGKAS